MLIEFATVLLLATAPSTEPPQTLEAFPIPVQAQAPYLKRGGSDYRIGRQDLLELKVFDLKELDQTVRVADDGSITLPLLGRLDAAGLTKGELEALIARLLEERFVRNPQVTIFVREYQSKKVAVSGAVKKPDTYEMLGEKTLLEMISLAGGLDRDLGKEIIIFRPQADGTQRIAVDLDKLVYEADPTLNVAVLPGDIVYVFPLPSIGVRFYGPRFGLQRSDWIASVCDRNETRAYIKDVDLFRGTPRLWILTGGSRPFRFARAAVLQYLGAIGKRTDLLSLPSSTYGSVTLELYNLSDPTRLSQADAETFPAPPMATDPRPGCREWVSHWPGE
jgi:protein involved in polysaccharide export with SLBB domain